MPVVHSIRAEERAPGAEPPPAPVPSPRKPSELFTSPAASYDRFMGRYVPPLAAALADAAGVGPGMRVLDVGCGPGGLTGVLAARVGADQVAAIDAAPQFVTACRQRHPGVDVREGVAEHLPWPDGRFDAVLSSLVIGFLHDPDLTLREMARVARPGGAVAVCMWDLAEGGMTMLRLFWSALHSVRPAAPGESSRPGTSRGDIAARLRRAGLVDVVDGQLHTRAEYVDFDDFWEPFTLGVGPAGQALAGLPVPLRAAVRETCRAQLPDAPFTLEARAWYAVGRVRAAG